MIVTHLLWLQLYGNIDINDSDDVCFQERKMSVLYVTKAKNEN
jgi:hypothetical protein